MFRSVAARALQRPAQDGAFGSGSHRNDDAPGHASGRSRRHRRTTAVSGSACRTADGALLLRPYGSLPGVTFQARSHRSRQSGSIASLLSVLALPQRPVSGRCRTRGGQMPRSAPYDDLLMDMLKDEDRALAYLNAALDEPDPRVFLVALRNVTQAQGGIAKIV